MQRVAQSLEPLGADAVVLRDLGKGSNGLGIDVNLWAPYESTPTWALAQQPNNDFHSPTNVDDYWDW